MTQRGYLIAGAVAGLSLVTAGVAAWSVKVWLDRKPAPAKG